MAATIVQPHALLVPFSSAQGHVNAFMHLAQSLATEGFAVTFVYFARSYSVLQQENRVKSNPAIRIEVVPDGLSEDHSVVDLLDILVFDAVGKVQEGLEQLVQEKLNKESRITCIISDNMLPWTQNVADKFGIPRIDFWTSTATAYAMLLHLPQLFSKGYAAVKGPITSCKSEDDPMIDFIPGLPPFHISEYPKEALVEGIVFQMVIRSFSGVRDAERILIHSMYELESSVFDALRADQLPVYSVGPLFQSALSMKKGTPAEADSVSSLPSEEDCLTWLDTQAESSVIYLAFGSVFSLSSEETQELAFGIEASTHPFIWVIRSDSIKGDLSDMLPEGFLSRTKQRGLIISWAPQVAVLAHSSVGGFLTHCGWNSTLESICMGVPMIGCPRGGEQLSTLRRIAHEWKVGLELERKQDGGFVREDVERAVKALMGGEEGKEARRRAGELREVARKTVADGGVTKSNLKKFAEDMRRRASLQNK